VAGNGQKCLNEASTCGEMEHAAVSLTECQLMDIDDCTKNNADDEAEHAEERAGNSALTVTSNVITQDQHERFGAEEPGDGSFSECRSMDVEYNSSHNEDKATADLLERAQIARLTNIENQKSESIEGTAEISAISTTFKSEVPRSEPCGSIVGELEAATLEPVTDSIQQTTGSTQAAHAGEVEASNSGVEVRNPTEQSAERNKFASEDCR
jgi:hypothetical protein